MKATKLAQFATLLTVTAGFAFTASASVASDSALQEQIQSKLKNKQFSQVTVASNNGIVTLTGTVDKYQAKVDAEKKARKLSGVKEVDDQIDVAGKQVPDAVLQQTLNRKLSYDRFGYGHVFNSVTASVNDGVVTLDGQVRWDPDKDSALALVSNQDGVKDVIDRVKVLPTSMSDDELRVRVYRALYGDSSLAKYSMDPAAPIRIVVDNGHVALYGTVISQADKNIAGIRANGVFGAFTVQNNLTVNKG
jgi:osmotically-inducible protein OsmY